MAESLLRTFISVSLPKEIVNIKKMLQSTIDSKGAEIKWVRDGNMHLSLKFIGHTPEASVDRSEEHTSELQSRTNLVCRLLLEKKKKNKIK